MAKIEDKSIFGEYKQPENRVTAAFLHLLRICGERLICHLFKGRLEGFPDSEIYIDTQNRTQAGVADGEIKCDFSFKIQVECKLTDGINKEQLKRYKQHRKSGEYLVYIVKSGTHNDKITNIPYFTWNDLDNLLSEYEEKYVLNDIERYLIEQFKMMLENNDLVDKYEKRVIVVAGGWGKGIAQKYHFYVCQNHRSFRRAKYLAFYHDKKIEYMYEIDDNYPQDNVSLKDPIHNIPPDFFDNEDPNYQECDKRKLFKLGKNNLLSKPIVHNKVNDNGRIAAYTQKQRYVSIDSINEANTTDDLKDVD